MGWIDAELALTALAAMLSPTTLTFSVLVLVLGDRPLSDRASGSTSARSAATLGIGIVAAFVLGNAAASRTPSTPKTWVAVLDVVLALGLLGFVVWALRRPPNPEADREHDRRRCEKVASSPIVAIARRGRSARQPGRVHPDRVEGHLRARPECDPVHRRLDLLLARLATAAGWRRSCCCSSLRRGRSARWARVRGWLDRNARNVAAVIVVLLALSLLRNGIAGLTGLKRSSGEGDAAPERKLSRVVRMKLALAPLALAVVLVAGCGGSSSSQQLVALAEGLGAAASATSITTWSDSVKSAGQSLKNGNLSKDEPEERRPPTSRTPRSTSRTT